MKRKYIEKKVGEDWLPLNVVSRSKSQLKKLYQARDQLKDAFIVGNIPCFDSLGKGIEDSTYTFISFSGRQNHELQEEELLTGASVMKFMVARAEEFFSLPNSHTYVLAFDKKQHVPRNKREKQIRENLNDETELIPFVWSAETEDHVLYYDQPLPCSWESLKLNREARAQAMQDVVQMIKNHYRPPPGKRLIVDSDTYDSPLVITLDLVGSTLECYEDERLRNSIGEADNGIMYYVQLFSTGGADVDPCRGSIMDRPSWNGQDSDDILVVSKDTDVWLTLMLLYEQRYKSGDFVNRVIVYTGNVKVTSVEGSKTTVQTAQALDIGLESDPFIAALMTDEAATVTYGRVALAPPPSQRISDSEQLTSSVGSYIDMNALIECAINHLTLPDGSVLPHGPESLFVVSIMGGNDYVDGYYGITYETLLNTWFKFYDVIGSLVEFNEVQGRRRIAITPSRYLRLLINAFYQAYEKNSVLDPVRYPTKRTPKPNFAPGAPHNLNLHSLTRIIATLKSRHPDYWVPSADDIGYRMRRTEWNLRYCYEGWKQQPWEHVPNPENHGWEKAVIRWCTLRGKKGQERALVRKITLHKRQKL